MKVTATAAAILASVLLWTATFYTAQATYHVGLEQGVIPNLHIREHMGLEKADD